MIGPLEHRKRVTVHAGQVSPPTLDARRYKSAARVAAPVIGAVIGSAIPGVGTAIGASIGAAAGAKATGGSWGDAAKAGALSYVGSSIVGPALADAGIGTSFIGDAASDLVTGAGASAAFGDAVNNAFGSLTTSTLYGMAGTNFVADAIGLNGKPQEASSSAAPPAASTPTSPGSIAGSPNAGSGGASPVSVGGDATPSVGFGGSPVFGNYFRTVTNRLTGDLETVKAPKPFLDPNVTAERRSGWGNLVFA